MNRRGFLKLLGAATAVTAAGVVLVEPEPVRRFWQVGRAAPVRRLGRRVRSTDLTFNPPDSSAFEEPVWLTSEHGFTYNLPSTSFQIYAPPGLSTPSGQPLMKSSHALRMVSIMGGVRDDGDDDAAWLRAEFDA
jgi:hypothetical protein